MSEYKRFGSIMVVWETSPGYVEYNSGETYEEACKGLMVGTGYQLISTAAEAYGDDDEQEPFTQKELNKLNREQTFDPHFHPHTVYYIPTGMAWISGLGSIYYQRDLDVYPEDREWMQPTSVGKFPIDVSPEVMRGMEEEIKKRLDYIGV